MARTKVYKINLTDNQINDFKNALHSGCPLMVALSFAKIHPTTYFYYVDLANISAYHREKQMLKEHEEIIKSGVDIEAIKDESKALAGDISSVKNVVRPYREPTGTSILRYQNNKTFAALCDEVYDLLEECDRLRAEVAMFHLREIMKHSGERGVNTVGSQWYLERTMPDYFGRVEKTKFEGSVKNTMTIGEDDTDALPPIKVEFVDPNTLENKNRVKDMEDLVNSQILGKSQA